MSKSSSVYTRVEPNIKEQAEKVLSKLGLPMSSAINLYLHQIVLHDGIPFSISVPNGKTLDFDTLSNEQFDREIQIGIDSLIKEDVISSEQVRSAIEQQYYL